VSKRERKWKKNERVYILEIKLIGKKGHDGKPCPAVG
jgi:hypothetical protein